MHACVHANSLEIVAPLPTIHDCIRRLTTVWKLAGAADPHSAYLLSQGNFFLQFTFYVRKERAWDIGMMQDLLRSTLSGRIWPPLPDEQ